MTGSASQASRLRLLLDSNVVIAVEPYGGVLESGMRSAVKLLRLANEQGHLLCVAPATRDDVLQVKDVTKREQRLAELEKFHVLQEVPLPAALVEVAGSSDAGSNDHRDLRIIAALYAGAATYLVSDDYKLRKRAERAGLAERVMTLEDAVGLLVQFAPAEVPPPPRVSKPATYTLRTDDPIFDSLREDYDGFDAWFEKVRAQSESRSCYLIEEGGRHAALALIKPEPECEYDGLAQPVVKICTFKVSANHADVKFGELLLKAILTDAAESPTATLYVEVLPTHPEVIGFLQNFGFFDTGHRNARGEQVLAKSLQPIGDQTDDQLTDLDFHIRYGPPALRCRQQIFVVPIEPRWHDQLFPEQAPERRSEQLELFDAGAPETQPWGNALRKAYLCNSPSKQICSGDVLLFYRSGDRKSISAVGIVEETLRSADADEVVQFVGRRTVYSAAEISHMARSVRGVLSVRFRQDRFQEPPWTFEQLLAAQVLRSWPQSITKLTGASAAWVRERLAE
ncbi:GNAT family N-acetyltransferase [Nocardioides sp. TRM66260-LWL]|uniref:GNAT family N-acetyltransferase n=1 Tax=Nocardioides sp. TRM66260-LWL TaxID=2874478 RepID=UPI001CC62964|nr:GNAT family N-acetyltransferase [Nocardioides sp. TRM66260-LWL]MBZ5735640.1 GNAT family N-acetyltransferase [Nocardioides sp. TRM66260-LWL]